MFAMGGKGSQKGVALLLDETAECVIIIKAHEDRIIRIKNPAQHTNIKLILMYRRW